ncbi:hypothetical protein EX30DRAFT_364424 [Ascodesmis nigricans]|uniref:Uncharacterized protein n=1 Tax=Ascodesmis nigricans TaxID=341454 RepID=A0A4S2MV83_9PEZI|nr:hypothetical protein EX30DRAFT_364424 [Ascodesmis nigricans]
MPPVSNTNLWEQSTRPPPAPLWPTTTTHVPLTTITTTTANNNLPQQPMVGLPQQQQENSSRLQSYGGGRGGGSGSMALQPMQPVLAPPVMSRDYVGDENLNMLRSGRGSGRSPGSEVVSGGLSTTNGKTTTSGQTMSTNRQPTTSTTLRRHTTSGTTPKLNLNTNPAVNMGDRKPKQWYQFGRPYVPNPGYVQEQLVSRMPAGYESRGTQTDPRITAPRLLGGWWGGLVRR